MLHCCPLNADAKLKQAETGDEKALVCSADSARKTARKEFEASSAVAADIAADMARLEELLRPQQVPACL